jgi:chemotaxis protein MotB
MRRRHVVPNPHTVRASGDRWLFGYADVVTLLLACFVSLYATGLAPAASPEPEPVPAVADVETSASSEPTPVEDAVVDVTEAIEAVPRPVSKFEQAFEGLVGDATSLPGMEMTSSVRGLVISLPEAGSFAPGRADLSPSARAVMLDLADRLRDQPWQIRVEGHTDDRPISTTQFASNWDLSTARATRVVALLIEAGIAPDRLGAAGYGEHRPRVPNTSPETRARNRRVDIVVLDPLAAAREDPGEAGEPSPAPSAEAVPLQVG